MDKAIDELRQESQKRTSASFSFNPKEKGMTTVGEEDKVTSTVAKQQPNLRKRRMSIIHYKKEQSLVVILAMVTFMFTISTIPSSIILIFKYLQHEETNGNATFEVKPFHIFNYDKELPVLFLSLTELQSYYQLAGASQCLVEFLHVLPMQQGDTPSSGQNCLFYRAFLEK